MLALWWALSGFHSSIGSQDIYLYYLYIYLFIHFKIKIKIKIAGVNFSGCSIHFSDHAFLSTIHRASLPFLTPPGHQCSEQWQLQNAEAKKWEWALRQDRRFLADSTYPEEESYTKLACQDRFDQTTAKLLSGHFLWVTFFSLSDFRLWLWLRLQPPSVLVPFVGQSDALVTGPGH